MAGAENPVCLPCLAPSLQAQCRPQSCLKTAGPLPTLIACFLLHSTYVPVPSKIKVKKNQVSGGSGPSSPELRPVCEAPQDDRENAGPAGIPAAGGGGLCWRHQPWEGSHL